MRWGFLILELIFFFFIYCGLFVLILVVFVLFLLSLRFGQISPLAFFRWFTVTLDRNAESCNHIPSNYCLPSLLSIAPRFFYQVNLWPAWVGFETAIFWQCSLGTVETQHLYPLHHGPRRAIKDGFFGLINPIICSPYLVFHSRVRTKFVIIFNWNHFEMRLLNLRINFFF